MSVARPKMGEATPDGLTGREAEIMDRRWKLGAATAEQIREGLSGKPHDSTVRTLLRILEEKECVRAIAAIVGAS